MALVNEHFLKLASNYLFADIAKKVNAYKIAHPKQRVISLGIGDVTQPLCPAVIKAMHKAVDEMAVQASFRGYGPERGYDFLREAIIKNDFLPRGIHLDANEVFVNDGAKSDTGNIQEILRWGGAKPPRNVALWQVYAIGFLFLSRLAISLSMSFEIFCSVTCA